MNLNEDLRDRGEKSSERSEVLVMRRSLLILDVMFVVELDSAVSKLSIVDLVAAMTQSARASPVPVHSADELESRNFLVSEVSNDFKHFSTVAIETEDLKVEETWSIESILQEQSAGGNASDQKFGTLSVLPQLPLHLN